MSNAKELDRVLVVNDQEYNVNAVHSETADKVNNKLTINEYRGNGYTTKEFDGSADTSISFVPASGGDFEGNITTPNHKTSMSISDASVLNKSEISTLVGKLTGASWYTWNYNKDTDTGVLTVKTDETTNEIQKIGIVVGDDDHETLSGFALTNSQDKLLPFYLYISYRFKTDNVLHDDSIGNIYLGTADSATMVQLTNRLAYSDLRDNPWTADDLYNLELVLFGIGESLYEYQKSGTDSFLDRIVSLEGKAKTVAEIVDEIDQLLETAVANELSAILNHLDKKAQNNFNANNKNAHALIKVIRALRDYTNNLYTKLAVDDTDNIWVKKATYATSAGNATNATNADKATNDEHDRNISTNYYRTGNNSYKFKENTITFDHKDPRKEKDWTDAGLVYNPDAGNNGDIWILV